MNITEQAVKDLCKKNNEWGLSAKDHYYGVGDNLQLLVNNLRYAHEECPTDAFVEDLANAETALAAFRKLHLGTVL
jgi:hypothetical protein